VVPSADRQNLRSGGRKSAWAHSLPALLLVLTALHAGALGYDVLHPGAFLTGDRAPERMWTGWGMLSSAHSPELLWRFLATHGLFGDYAYHAALFAVGGRIGVIFVQVLLHLAAVACLYRLTALMTRVRWAPLVAAASFGLLPNLVVYHEAVSEGLSTPLFAISVYALAIYFLQGRRIQALVLSGLTLGVVITIRPQAALWPVPVVAILLAAGRSRRWLAPSALYVLLAWLPLGAWASFMKCETGSFSLGGATTHDLSYNLFMRVVLMSDEIPESERREVRQHYVDVPQGRPLGMSVARYVSFIREHPGAYLKYYAKDLVIFVGNPGVTHLLVDYCPRLLGARPRIGVDVADHWRLHGPADAFRFLLSESPGLLVAWVGGTIALIVYWTGACVGLWSCWRRRGTAQPVGSGPACFALAALIPYCALAGQAAGHLSVRYRAPAEFALSLFFALGAAHLLRGSSSGADA
jgi:4-amino-4-deoxy-L-arabinose transferase-like glycosyltransferase